MAVRVLDSMSLVRADHSVLDRAARLQPPALRSLDAIHLASALELDEALSAFVTYDRQLERAAAAAGLSVETPGR